MLTCIKLLIFQVHSMAIDMEKLSKKMRFGLLKQMKEKLLPKQENSMVYLLEINHGNFLVGHHSSTS